MRRLRVALITTSYPTDRDDPSGHFVRTEALALIEAGHEVTVLAPKAIRLMSHAGFVQPKPRQHALDAGIELVELPHWGLFGWPGALERLRQRPWRVAGLLPFVSRARQALRKRGPFDRLVAHWLVPSLWPISRDYAGEAHVVAHGSDVRLVERLPRSAQRCIVLSLSRPNVTIRCVSSELASRLRRLASAHRVPTLSLVIEPAALDVPVLGSKNDLCRAAELSAGPIVVIVGRVVKDKRIDVAIEVVTAACSATKPEIQPPPVATADDPASRTSSLPELRPTLVVIGDGPLRRELMQRYPSVRWLGQLGRLDTLRYIRMADLLVSASLKEGAPTVVREARALGTKVVAAAAGDLCDWARNDPDLSVTQFFVAPPDPRAVDAVALVRRELDAIRGASETR